ncbi:MAG: hypothetical protein GXO32_06165 [Crenarchaeota archaeon]|nr:hypothetical protein [Thermoproteota archaeon]
MSTEGSSKLRLLRIKELSNDLLLLEVPPNHTVMSNAINWRLGSYRYVAIARVPRDLRIDSPREIVESVAREKGLDPSSTLMLLTAAKVSESLVLDSTESPVSIDVVATVGLEPPACVDIETVYRPLGAATINVVVSVDEGLAPPGLADLFKLVVEAKSVAIASLTLQCRSLPFGTLTDGVAVTARAGSAVCAGIATDIGNAVAKMIRNALVSFYRRSRRVGDALKDVVGLTIDDLVREAMRAYREAPIPGASDSEIESEIRAVLAEVLSDPNVWCILLSARYLDDRGRAGTIWRLPRGEYEADSPRIVADEIMGISLASYIHGYRAVFATYWIERLKSRRVLERVSQLPMFLDDVVSALIASALSIVYTRRLKEVGDEL